MEVGTFFRRLLERKGYRVKVAASGAEAVRALDEQQYQVAMVDLKLPDANGLSLLQEIKNRQPGCEVIIMTGYSTTKTAVKAIQLGAFDYIDKPFEDIAEVEDLIDKACDYGKSLQHGAGTQPEWFNTAAKAGFLVGGTAKMFKMVSIADKIAKKNINVLIQGETGTGKEVLARFIHAASNRSDMLFIPVNCGAFPENLLESELFGHEKGAFTGASSQRRGIFELADRGTLFLDEIGEASLSIQVKLLRVLETGEFLRVGGEKTIHTDVRIVAATNIDLEQAVRDKLFREDLFYRLDVVRFELPPLRERREDIPLLVKHFLKRNSEFADKEPPQVSGETMRLLMEYSWPGNIRELANTIDQAVALCDGPVILPNHLSDKIMNSLFPQNNWQTADINAADNVPANTINGQLQNLLDHREGLVSMSPEELLIAHRLVRAIDSAIGEAIDTRKLPRPEPPALQEVEARAIRDALSYHRGNVTSASRSLGIGRNTLYRKMKEYNIDLN
ncbi:sigma-54-dependent transcriptional regulator [Desulfocucumis palustris]